MALDKLINFQKQATT